MLNIYPFTTLFDIISTTGEVPKWLKGLVSKTSRRESVQGFKSLLLRYELLSNSFFYSHQKRSCVLTQLLLITIPTLPLNELAHYVYHQYLHPNHSSFGNLDSIPAQTAMPAYLLILALWP